MKKYIVILMITLFFACAPYTEKEVTITKNYVINPNWDKQNNRIEIKEMKLKDTTERVNPNNATSFELLKNLVKDENSSYVANVEYNGEDYSERKVFFDQENNFVWRKPPSIDPSRINNYITIGTLKKETWYLLSGLSNVNTLYYIYINSSGKLYKFRVPASDWTNI
jgi:hypothetical protein